MILNSDKIFQNVLFVLDLGIMSYKNKKKIREKITDNGGIISYILTKKSDFVVAAKDNSAKLDTYKTRKAQQLNIPIVSEEFIHNCIEANHLIDCDPYRVVGLTKSDKFKQGKIQVAEWTASREKQVQKEISVAQLKSLLSRKFITGAKECPLFCPNFQVVKFVILEGSKEIKNVECENYVCVLELHVSILENEHLESEGVSEKYRFKMLEQSCILVGDDASPQQFQSYQYYFNSCENALMAMQYLVDEKRSKYKQNVLEYLPHVKLGSSKLRHMLDEMGASAGILHPNVAKLVVGIVQYSLGEIARTSSYKDISTITPDQITKAVVLLMKIRMNLKNNTNTAQLSNEFYSSLSITSHREVISDLKTLSKKQDFVQLLKDALLLSESSSSQMSSILSSNNLDADMRSCDVASFYKMLKCSITHLDPDDPEYQNVLKLMCGGDSGSLPTGFTVKNIFQIHRDVEDGQFTHSLSPTKLLFHASDPQNFIGILSRGLLLPLVVMDEFGGERSDIGMFGNSIYFADDIRKSIGYSKLNPLSGSRLILVNEVALGACRDYSKRVPTLLGPPEGYDSVRGVGKHIDPESEFEMNEYAVYKVQQQRMRYLIEFVLEGDSPGRISDVSPTALNVENVSSISQQVNLDDVEGVKNPLESVKSGLITSDSKRDRLVLLKEVHVRAKVLDMVAEVVIMQVYVNKNSSPLEAKYVFPLDDNAAVCGFEAFINEKHVIGKVKKKEVAHKEYREAIDAGHGAYLMDEEKPDVFTVSVGNLPPRSRVLIKITYVTELPVVSSEDGSSDCIQFFLPSSISSAVRKRALISGPVTQTSVDRVTADGNTLSNTSLAISIEMPFDIRQISCPTHRIHVKKTATKACVKLAKSDALGKTEFKLLMRLAEIHVPRMWVEQHPDDDSSQACMLAFYPEFEAQPILNYKAIVLLDMSQSMKSKDSANLEQEVKKLALMILKHLPCECFVNVVKFGSAYSELFVNEQPLCQNRIKEQAEDFIQSCNASYGSSDVWRPLASFEAILNSSNTGHLTNIFLLSDGHLSEENRLLEISRSLGKSRDSSKGNQARIFSFSVGTSANQHLLGSISSASGGAHAHFASDSKSKWERKIQNQLTKAGQPALKDIKIDWKQYNDENPEVTEKTLPQQAPENITSLFNSCRLVVYGYISHCTQAELVARICDQEISTVVSTSQLSITTGKMLHRLTARAMIKDFEEGVHDVSPLLRNRIKTARKPHITELSCKHDVVSPYTSFIAVEERKENESMDSHDAPSVAELVNTVDVDCIPEVSWDEDALEENLPQMQRVKNEIERAETSYSVRDSLRHFEIAENLLDNLHSDELQGAKVMISLAKSRLQMDFDPPLVNQDFVHYLTNILNDQEKLNMFVSLVLESDVECWKKSCIDPVTLKGIYTKVNAETRDIITDGTKQAVFEDWWERIGYSLRHLHQFTTGLNRKEMTSCGTVGGYQSQLLLQECSLSEARCVLMNMTHGVEDSLSSGFSFVQKDKTSSGASISLSTSRKLSSDADRMLVGRLALTSNMQGPTSISRYSTSAEGSKQHEMTKDYLTRSVLKEESEVGLFGSSSSIKSSFKSRRLCRRTSFDCAKKVSKEVSSDAPPLPPRDDDLPSPPLIKYSDSFNPPHPPAAGASLGSHVPFDAPKISSRSLFSSPCAQSNLKSAAVSSEENVHKMPDKSLKKELISHEINFTGSSTVPTDSFDDYAFECFAAPERMSNSAALPPLFLSHVQSSDANNCALPSNMQGPTSISLDSTSAEGTKEREMMTQLATRLVRGKQSKFRSLTNMARPSSLIKRSPQVDQDKVSKEVSSDPPPLPPRDDDLPSPPLIKYSDSFNPLPPPLRATASLGSSDVPRSSFRSSYVSVKSSRQPFSSPCARSNLKSAAVSSEENVHKMPDKSLKKELIAHEINFTGSSTVPTDSFDVDHAFECLEDSPESDFYLANVDSSDSEDCYDDLAEEDEYTTTASSRIFGGGSLAANLPMKPECEIPDLKIVRCLFEDRSSLRSQGSSAEGEEEDYEENAKTLQGFRRIPFILSDLDVDLDDLLTSICEYISKLKEQEVKMSQIIKKIVGRIKSPFDHEDFPERAREELVARLDEILKSAGALSLGVPVYEELWRMVVIALLLGLFEVEEMEPEHLPVYTLLRDCLKRKDLEHPSLYFRLRLGNSWSEAASNIALQLINFIDQEGLLD